HETVADLVVVALNVDIPGDPRALRGEQKLPDHEQVEPVDLLLNLLDHVELRDLLLQERRVADFEFAPEHLDQPVEHSWKFVLAGVDEIQNLDAVQAVPDHGHPEDPVHHPVDLSPLSRGESLAGRDEDLVLAGDVTPHEQTPEQVGGSARYVQAQHLLGTTVRDSGLEAPLTQFVDGERRGPREK